jgi:hypothetical protein
VDLVELKDTALLMELGEDEVGNACSRNERDGNGEEAFKDKASDKCMLKAR